MLMRRLGRSGYQVSEIGFGAWGIGGGMWQGGNDEHSAHALRQAIALGITLIDTALAYGQGHSERLIASVLDRHPERHRIIIATKIPPMYSVWPARATTPFEKVFPARHIVDCVERSLANLKVDALPLEQFHVWNDAWLSDPAWPETRDTMVRLVEQGKVLHWGVSVSDHAPETALGLLADPLIDTAQAIYNIFDRSPERGLFDMAREKPLGVIVRVPFDEGALTGAIGPETVFPAGDWRERYFRGERKAEAARRAADLEALLGEEARSLPELALRFCLSRPEVSTVISGMRSARHAEENASVSDGRVLSAGLLEQLGRHAWEKNWYAQ